jgi:hypothetical protein
MSHEPRVHLQKLSSFYEFNVASIGPPTRYLGANVTRVSIPGDDSGNEFWAISSRTYVQNAVKNVKEMLQYEGGLKQSVKTLFMSGYRPELDVTDELDHDLAS